MQGWSPSCTGGLLARNRRQVLGRQVVRPNCNAVVAARDFQLELKSESLNPKRNRKLLKKSGG